MTISISNPVTGGAVTGLTSPTHTWTQSSAAPNSNSKSYYVSAIGGTQSGSDTSSSAARPWTVTFSRPQSLKQLNAVDATGVVRNVAFNTYDVTYRRGLTPLAGQASKTSVWRLSMPIPAGADTADTPNLKSAISAFTGLMFAQANNLYDLFVTGEM